MPRWIWWWWNEHTVSPLARLVGPPRECQRTWWTSHQDARVVQPGHWQCPSRARIARRSSLVYVRCVCPTSSGTPSASSTRRVTSQSHINRSSSEGGTTVPSSSSANATGATGTVPAPTTSPTLTAAAPSSSQRPVPSPSGAADAPPPVVSGPASASSTVPAFARACFLRWMPVQASAGTRRVRWGRIWAPRRSSPISRTRSPRRVRASARRWSAVRSSPGEGAGDIASRAVRNAAPAIGSRNASTEHPPSRSTTRA